MLANLFSRLRRQGQNKLFLRYLAGYVLLLIPMLCFVPYAIGQLEAAMIDGYGKQERVAVEKTCASLDAMVPVSYTHLDVYKRQAYIFGAMSVAIPGWAVGTYLGVAVGNLLTPGLLSALSVGLYGMFLAVILPPARKDKKLLALILVSMALSYAVRALPGLSFLSDNMKTIVLTVGISLLAAVFFPIREAKA